jgi:hypothetical protein
MTEPAPRPRPVTRWRALVLLAAAAALLAGCDLATGTVRTATELQEAGIRNPDLQYDSGTATLRYDADPNPLEVRQEQDEAARVIWENLPFQLDRIVVSPDGSVFPGREYSRAELERVLGPRPAGLDRSVEDIARRAAVIAAVVALVLLVLVIVVILLVVRAVRRRPAPQPAGTWPQGAGPPQWGQPAPPPQPPQQQPWGAQPPAPGWPPPAQPGQPAPPGPPARGPGDTQRLESGGPPPEEGRGPVPPA